MSIASVCKPFSVVAFAAASVLTAQNWTVTTNMPSPAPFLTPSIASDTSGVLMCDEGTTQTFALLGGTWMLQPPSATHTLFGTTIGGGTSVLRFGGIGAALTNTIMRFDRATTSWVTLTPASAPPLPRFFAAGATINALTAIVFGGRDATTVFGDTWQVTDVGGAALWLPLATPPALVPRSRSSMARGPGNTAVLFGGVDAANTVLGDTWVSASGTWSQVTGTGPTAVTGASMTFDPVRNMTVLVNSNGPTGETWEWNGFSWRKVGALGAPLVLGAQVAFDATSNAAIVLQPTAPAFDMLAFTPSPASFQITLPQNPLCIADPLTPGSLSFQLANVTRSLPIMGQNLDTRLDRVMSAALVVGAFEFATGFSSPGGCNCNLGLLLNGATQIIVIQNGVGNWSLPIANTPLLFNVALDMQAFAFEPAIACGVASTARATIVIGR